MRAVGVVLLLSAVQTDLLDLSRLSAGGTLGPEWSLHGAGSTAPSVITVVDTDRGRALRVSGQGQAVWAVRELRHPIAPGARELRWVWRVLRPPEGADLRDREADDAALRVFVVFGKSGGLSRKNRAIFYTWGNAEPNGLELPSHVSGKLHVVRLAGDAEVGLAWRSEAVAPFADYRRIWGREPEPITAVGLMQDTDMTHMSAVGELRALILGFPRPPRAANPSPATPTVASAP
jgi:hypothetical protein